MGPASRALEGILAIVALAVAVLIAVCLFRALRGSRRRRVSWAVGAAVAVLVGQLTAVAAVGIHVNRQLGLYLDWQSLRDALVPMAACCPTPPDRVTRWRASPTSSAGRSRVKAGLRTPNSRPVEPVLTATMS